LVRAQETVSCTGEQDIKTPPNEPVAIFANALQKGTDDVLFFSWTVNVPSTSVTCSTETFEGNMQGQGEQNILRKEFTCFGIMTGTDFHFFTHSGGCAALTSFQCNQNGEDLTFTFNQSDFCDGGSIADAIINSFTPSPSVICNGGPA
jgi:hypothetical protein